MIPFKNRFHGHGSLGYLNKNGQVFRNSLLTIKAVSNKFRKDSRLAVVVSRKISKSAVKRNFLRRRIYDIARPRLLVGDNIMDVIFIVNSSELITLSRQETEKIIDELISQLKF